MKTPREVAESYWRAECERDLEAVLEHYHTDAVVQPPSGPSLRGRDEIATFYADELRDYPHLEVQIVHEVSSGDEASLEWEAVLTDHEGGRHPFRGVNIVRTRDGMFEWVRAYFDPALPEAVE
ncbi:MAG: nuclear transport factor 2 family protein [Euzebyales bacterium]|jgi:ketosteroid isomerase-like protein|nr:nuclear transport factor 2 family protein [Euzebyales bacterium]